MLHTLKNWTAVEKIGVRFEDRKDLYDKEQTTINDSKLYSG